MPLSLKTVEAGRGRRWIGDGLRLFARRPLGFTSLVIVFFLLGTLVVPTLVSVLPPLRWPAQLLQASLPPLLSLGFMVASHSVLTGGPARLSHFIEPLRGDPARRRALLLLCLLYGVGFVVTLLLVNHVSDNAWARLQGLMMQEGTNAAEVDALLSEPGVSTGALLLMVLGSLLSVLFWHAPALVHWGGQGVAQALFSSTLAVWRNKGAFVVYTLGWVFLVGMFSVLSGVLLALLGVPGLMAVIALPGGVIITTVFYVSLLFTFNDSFGGAAAAAPETAPEAP